MFGLEAEFWVAIAFLILMGVFGYFGIHRTLLKALDSRRDRIKADLDDARRLKDEARKLLAEYRARRETAVREADEIVANAKAEARAYRGGSQDQDGRFRRPSHQIGREQDRDG